MTGRETINLFLFLIVLMAVTVGCDKNASLWSQAQANGQNRVFSANLGGKHNELSGHLLLVIRKTGRVIRRIKKGYKY